RADVFVHACLIEENHNAGVTVFGSDATIEATVVRSTQPDAHDTSGGIGAQDVSNPDFSDTLERANVTLRACLVEDNHGAGVPVDGSAATSEARVVRGTRPNAAGRFGDGIGSQIDPDTMERADVDILGCLIEKNQQAGVIVVFSDATITGTAVHETAPKSDN